MSTEQLILQLHYSSDRQNRFSLLSGDYNPIHDNPIYARRTLVGAQVVHGLHHLLAGMEAWLEHLDREGGPPKSITGFTAQFLKPVLVGDTLCFYLTPLGSAELRVSGKIEDEIMCQLMFSLGGGLSAADQDFQPPPREVARDLAFADLEGLRGSLPLALDRSLAMTLFPKLTLKLGSPALAEILALTRLVGMHCPGLHSLFSEARITLGVPGGPGAMAYEVERTDERFGKVVLGVEGCVLKGRLTTFFRPPPAPQPGMKEVAQVVASTEFSDSVALVIGGSRGLGEITAKIIAAGGGLPIITYHRGAQDAERLAEEIRSWGARCEVLQFDVRNGEAVLQEQLNRQVKLTTIYYFATPKIGLRRGFLSANMLADYHEYYVTAFARLLSAATKAEAKLRVFYPSTVFVDENPREMAEYVICKRAAEDLCAFYNRYSKHIEIMVERLPRIKTDQTGSLMPVDTAESLDVMLPLVRKMERGGEA